MTKQIEEYVQKEINKRPLDKRFLEWIKAQPVIIRHQIIECIVFTACTGSAIFGPAILKTCRWICRDEIEYLKEKASNITSPAITKLLDKIALYIQKREKEHNTITDKLARWVQKRENEHNTITDKLARWVQKREAKKAK